MLLASSFSSRRVATSKEIFLPASDTSLARFGANGPALLRAGFFTLFELIATLLIWVRSLQHNPTFNKPV
jgi:hypothetical protein